MFERTLLHSLIQWKDQKIPKRKPLILKGARQVGKTFLVQHFAKQYFNDAITLNLERQDHLRHFRSPLSLEDFERICEVEFGKKIVDGETLIFLDEIQNSPAMLDLLRFFYEERPALHVIAAGSLLEAKIRSEGLSVPVGRVEYRCLYPLDFFEFLDAIGETRMHSALETYAPDAPLPPSIHAHANELFALFTIIGGMPEVVETYAAAHSFAACRGVSSSLLTAFADDVYKYTSHANARYVHYLIDHIPLIAGERTSYEKLGRGVYHSRELSRAREILEYAGVITSVAATESRALPLVLKLKRPRKYLFLDSGLIAFRSGIQEESFAETVLNDGFRGRFAEHIVGQYLHAMTGEHTDLLYWTREKTEGRAEIDFCFSYKGRAVGVEVKAGAPTTLRSLLSFGNLVPRALLVRISTAPLAIEYLSHQSHDVRLLSLPFYMLPRMEHFLHSLCT